MHTPGKWSLTVAALVLLGLPAWAQAPGGFGLGGGPILLMVPNVQEELKLTEEQTQKVPQILKQILKRERDEMAGLRDLPPKEWVKKRRDMIRTMNDEAKKSLALTAEQSRRFDQIGLQQRGYEAFDDPEVQDKLKLNDVQKYTIRAIGAVASDRLREITKGAGDDRDAALRKVRQLQKELMTKALAVLTDDQKAAWKELAGEPFEVRFERRRND